MAEYVRKCIWHALKETNDFFQFAPKSGAFLFFVALVGVYVARQLSGVNEGVTLESIVTDWIGPAAVLTGFAWILLFLISAVFHAPYRLYKRHRRLISKQVAKVSALKASLLEKHKNQELSDKMSDFHEEGIQELLNKSPRHDSELPAWRKREKTWRTKCLDEMRRYNCSRQEERHVRTLGLVTPFVQGPTPSITHQLNMLVTRLARIADIAAKYGD